MQVQSRTPQQVERALNSIIRSCSTSKALSKFYQAERQSWYLDVKNLGSGRWTVVEGARESRTNWLCWLQILPFPIVQNSGMSLLEISEWCLFALLISLEILRSTCHIELWIPLRRGSIPPTFACAPDEELYAVWGETMPGVEMRSLSSDVQNHQRKVDHFRVIEFSPDSRRLVILAGRKPFNTKCYIWHLERDYIQSVQKGIGQDKTPLGLFSFWPDGSLFAIFSFHRVYTGK